MPNQAHWQELILVLISLLVFIVAAVIVLTVLRRRGRDIQRLSSTEPFTLEQLRQLYYQGHLTESEFERAKINMCDRLSGTKESSPPGPEGPQSGPGQP
jgi:uncharacterized membrane protein